MSNARLKDIYRTLGPFDYTIWEPQAEDQDGKDGMDKKSKSSEDRSEASSVAGQSSRMAGSVAGDDKRVF